MMQMSLVIIYNWIRLTNNPEIGMQFSDECNSLNAAENVIYIKGTVSNS
jgi:hypothetical protein